MFDIPPNLVKDIVNGELTLFIGEGLSVDAGLMDWSAFIKTLSNELRNPDAGLPDLEVLNAFKTKYTEFDLMSRLLAATDTSGRELSDNHRRLTRLGITQWVTTNFDNFLRRTLEDAEQTHKLVYNNAGVPFTRRDGIILLHLRGHRDDPASLVMTGEQYTTRLTANWKVANLLGTWVQTTSALFLGFGWREFNQEHARSLVFANGNPRMRPAYGVFIDLRDEDVQELREQKKISVINLRRHPGSDDGVLLGCWLEDLIRAVDLERDNTRGDGNLPPVVKDLYQANPPSLHDHARHLKDVKQAILSGGSGKFHQVIGESGRGKSRLLKEAMAEVHRNDADALLLYVDLQTVAGSPLTTTERNRQLVLQLAAAAHVNISGGVTDPNQIAGLVLAHLGAHAHDPRKKACLIFDTTESLTGETQFWSWMVQHIMLPLLTQTRVALVFAGRARLEFPRESTRESTAIKGRAEPAIMVDRFEPGNPFERLAQDVLIRSHAGKLDEAQFRQAKELAVKMSRQHPGVCVEMSTYLAQNGVPADPETAKLNVARDVLGKFVDNVLLRDMDEKGRRIVKLCSVLGWDYYGGDLLDRVRRADPQTQYQDRDIKEALAGNKAKLNGATFGALSDELEDMVRLAFKWIEPDLYAAAVKVNEESARAGGGAYDC